MPSSDQESVDIVALHGFLGRPGDWDFLKSLPFTTVAVDLWARPILPVETWAEAIAAAPARLLIGYSMGARLALRLAILKPRLYSQLCLLSAHPGLASPFEREARLQADEAWAKKFETEKWAPLLEQWNAQPVLSGSSPLRREGDFSRPRLAASLRHWSLGLQPDLRSEIAKLPMPVKWIVGARDDKFLSLSRTLRVSKNLEVIAIPNAGHRLLEEAPEKILELVRGLF